MHACVQESMVSRGITVLEDEFLSCYFTVFTRPARSQQGQAHLISSPLHEKRLSILLSKANK